MNLYRIKISSRGSGWTDKKETDGVITNADGGLLISYKLDGDDCTLLIKDGKAVQKRHGSQPVEISFEEGKKTSCIIGGGGLCGSFEVYTESLKFVSGSGGCALSLKYLSGSDKEPVTLNFTAIKKL